MVSLGFIHGFLRVHVGLHVGFLIRISLSFLWVLPRVSIGLHLGYKQNRIKQKKVKNNEAVKTGSKEAKEQEIEQQKHMTEEKKKSTSRSRRAQKYKSREAGKTEKQKSKAGKAKSRKAEMQEKQRSRESKKQKSRKSRKSNVSREAEKQKIRETGKHRTRNPKKIQNLQRKTHPKIESLPPLNATCELWAEGLRSPGGRLRTDAQLDCNSQVRDSKCSCLAWLCLCHRKPERQQAAKPTRTTTGSPAHMKFECCLLAIMKTC